MRQVTNIHVPNRDSKSLKMNFLSITCLTEKNFQIHRLS